jgi:hypothetical protein
MSEGGEDLRLPALDEGVDVRDEEWEDSRIGRKSLWGSLLGLD